ncbi:MAG: BamA/TamA family outer membrane protein [Polyangiales bacterium]
MAYLLVLLGSNLAGAQTKDLTRPWQTVRSEHFEVNYPEPLGLLARRVLRVAERANARLAPLLGHQPKKRVQITLIDQSGSANGSAQIINYNQIRLFASAPADLSILGDFDDWMTELVTHEQTHIVHLDKIGGIPAVINEILGKVWAPNALQPEWLIEGIATYFESSLTSGGRLRSTQFEMYMRMAVLEDNILHFDTFNNRTDYWPQNNTWYLYGSRFIRWLVERYGEGFIEDMATWYGSRAIPYSINRMAQRLTGFTFAELYAMWIADMKAHYGEVARQVGRAGIVQGDRLTFEGQFVRGLRFEDDTHLIYYADDGRSDPQIRRMYLADGNRVERLVRSAGQSYPTLGPNGSIYFESADAYRGDIYFYFDLFRYAPTKATKRVRLTKGLRARYPDVSPDGQQVVYVRNSASTQTLWISDLEDIEGTTELLVDSKRFEQVYTPKYSPDGTRIAYSVWLEGGYRDIQVIDLETREVTRVTHDRAMDTGPAWAPDGQRLYFSSDRTGIANIYAWSPATGALEQITNLVSGAYTPAPSPDGTRLGYIGYTSVGFDVFMMDLDPAKNRPAPAYVDDRPPATVAKGIDPAFSERYVAARSLYPRAWGLDLQDDAFGQQLGITATGIDAAGFHEIFARLGISLTEGYVNAQLNYTLRRLPPDLALSLFRRVVPRAGFFVNGENRDYVEDLYGGRATISYRVPRSFYSNSISASYGLTWSRSLTSFSDRLDPNFPPPRAPPVGLNADVGLTWRYSDVRRQTFDYFPSEGRSILATINFAHPSIGSRFQNIRATWSIRRFIELPWSQGQVLAFRYGGGASEDSRGERGTFALGGFPETSFLEQLLNLEQIGGVALRGYPTASIVGDRFQLLQTEYRFPLTRVLRGPGTVPLFFNRMYALLFFDYGNAYFGPLDLGDFRKGTGAEILMDFTLGYERPMTLRIGFAYGLDTGGGAQFYINFGRPF